MKKRFVSEIKAGDAVDDVFVLAEKTMSHKKDGNSYLNVTLADKSGTIKGVVWDRVEEIADTVSAGDFVQVRAAVGEYREALRMVVRHMQAVAADSVDPTDFLPMSGRNIDGMLERLMQMTTGLQTPYLRALFEAFWQDAEFVQQFKRAPAAKKMHHAYIGGLLEHTLSMALLTERIAGHYNGVNREMLLAGAVLHDIGKVRELDYRFRIDYTDEGRLLSHIVIGLQLIDAKIKEVKDFPPEEAFLLKHMVVSHHGTREFGSHELPKTIEAVLLNYIDEMDSKVNGIRDFIAADESGEGWTAYHRLLGRQFYTGKGREETTP
ncbi:MAG: HD domain-containing protein [Desulfobacterales bacterium]|nr:HD domain-containing protein [Desulfobacterales bacterium]